VVAFFSSFKHSLGWRDARSCWFGLFYLTWVYCARFGSLNLSVQLRIRGFYGVCRF